MKALSAAGGLVCLGSLASALSLAGACVPPGNSTPSDAGTAAVAQIARPSVNVMTAPFEDNFERSPVDASGLSAPPAAPSAAAPALLSAFDASDSGRAIADGGPSLLPLQAVDAAVPLPPGNLGADWTAVQTSAWRIEGGRLCAQNARNHGIWLNRTLPVNARIEFTALAMSDDGDLKAELWGDGKSAATAISYTNATSYLTILGGWKNTFHVLARINEHGTDRKEIKVDPGSDDPRQKPVTRGQEYRFKVERTDGQTVRWSVNGLEYLSYTDSQPLAGAGHDHFGFNNWEVKVCFDDVKVTPL